MWESVEKLVNSGKGWFVLIIIFLIVLAVRMGYMKVKTDKILIGKTGGETERLIMKKQSEYAHYACMGFEKSIKRFDGYDETLGKLIAEKAYDEVMSWIMVNHIEVAPYYISNKQEIIWNLVVNETVDDRMRTEKFREKVYADVEGIIKQLVAIRDGGKD